MTGVILAILTAIAVHGQLKTVESPAGAARERIQAVVAAVESGDADRFEAAVQAHFTPEALARRTAADRRQLVERLRADFGRITAGAVDRRRDGRVRVTITGSTSVTGTLELVIDPANGDRISRLGIELGGPPEDAEESPAPPVSATMDREALAAALDSYLAPKEAADLFSGVVLLARDGSPEYLRAFGLADRESSIPNVTDTRFSLGSINKVFTKTATVQQLLDHQAGIADFFGQEFAGRQVAVPVQPRLPSAGVVARTDVCSRRPAPVLQRLLHRARRDHREGLWAVLRGLRGSAYLRAGRHARGAAAP